MQKILWLASWYPSRIRPYEGDFIQRHARALALFQPVDVIFVVKDDNGDVTRNIAIEEEDNNNLHETIVYYKPLQTKIRYIDKSISSARYLSLFKKQIKQYIEKNGFPSLIHVQVPMKAGVLALWCRKKYGIPFIVTEHWCAYNLLNPKNFFTRDPLFRRLTKRIFEAALLTETVCDVNAQELRSLFPIKKALVINNVADTRQFYYEPSKQSNPFTFVHVSSLTHQKNITGILTAFGKLNQRASNWRLIIIGPHTSELQLFAEGKGIGKNINWLGEVPYQTVADHVRNAHCMVMFSRYENSPCTIIEALCAGLPVIASNAGGIPEVINDTNGRMVDSENVEQLEKELADMIDHYSIYQCEQIARDAQAVFSYETVGRQIQQVYQEVLAADQPSINPSHR